MGLNIFIAYIWAHALGQHTHTSHSPSLTCGLWPKPGRSQSQKSAAFYVRVCACVCAARALVNPLQSLEERPLVSSFPCWNTLCQQQHTINACPAHVAYTQCGSHCTRLPTVLARLIILLNSTLNCIKYRAHFNYARIIRADE